MEYKEIKSLKGCVITKFDLLSLIDKLGDYADRFSITVNFTDRTSYSHLSNDEFSKEEFKNKNIESISVDYSKDDYKSIEGNYQIEIEKDIFSNKYEVRLKANDFKTFSFLKSVLFSWINSIQIHKIAVNIFNIPFNYIVSFLIGAVPTFLGIFKIFTKFKVQPNDWAAFIALLLPIVVCIIFAKILSFLFPSTEIDIGVNKHSKARHFAILFITAFLIPLIFFILSIVIT